MVPVRFSIWTFVGRSSLSKTEHLGSIIIPWCVFLFSQKVEMSQRTNTPFSWCQTDSQQWMTIFSWRLTGTGLSPACSWLTIDSDHVCKYSLLYTWHAPTISRLCGTECWNTERAESGNRTHAQFCSMSSARQMFIYWTGRVPYSYR